jgi:hypothetical protein
MQWKMRSSSLSQSSQLRTGSIGATSTTCSPVFKKQLTIESSTTTEQPETLLPCVEDYSCLTSPNSVISGQTGLTASVLVSRAEALLKEARRELEALDQRGFKNRVKLAETGIQEHASKASAAITSINVPNALAIILPTDALTTKNPLPELQARQLDEQQRSELQARPLRSVPKVLAEWYNQKVAWSLEMEERSFLPKYQRGYGWRNWSFTSEDKFVGPLVMHTLTATPIPRPDPSEFSNLAAMKTIQENPHLFKLVTPINVDRFEQLLEGHPNQPFVKSVCTGLREGFWPWANTHHQDGWPETLDTSWFPLSSDAEAGFLENQRDLEVQKERYSPAFGPDLLPGMYSTPIHAVPKPNSSDLRLVNNQSKGEFALNAMILHADVAGAFLDTLHHLIPALLAFRRQHPDVELTMFKSDVSEAYRLLPLHPLFQIKQIVTTGIPTKEELAAGVERVLVRNVDRNACFGNRGSPLMWTSFNGLVTWIAVYENSRVAFYAPYDSWMPADQVTLLQLWDELGIPHKQKKQLSGLILEIIGFLVDPNAMTATLSQERKNDLITAVRSFLSTPASNPRRRTLRDFQQLAGWSNWAFNVFPLLRPGLCNLYDKMAGKSSAFGLIYINKAVESDLLWMVERMEKSSGIRFFGAQDWNPFTESTLVIFCDACLEGMGFWAPEYQLSFFAPTPGAPPKDTIYFFEALCVASAVHWSVSHFGHHDHILQKLVVFTDNDNTVQAFNSLKVLPSYNPILKSTVNLLMDFDFDLRVVHVPGEKNRVADAISRRRFDAARLLVPGLIIEPFQPPQDALGVAEK